MVETFTSKEQGEQLLEYGIPIETADCMRLKNEVTGDYDYVMVINKPDDYNFLDMSSVPCWSVGRLVDILEGSMHCSFIRPSAYNQKSLLEDVLDRIKNTHDSLDFKKYLE